MSCSTCLDFSMNDIFNPTTFAGILAFFEKETGRGIAENDWRTFIGEYEIKTGKSVHPSMPPGEKKEFENYIWWRTKDMAKRNKWQLAIFGGMIFVFIALLTAKGGK